MTRINTESNVEHRRQNTGHRFIATKRLKKLRSRISNPSDSAGLSALNRQYRISKGKKVGGNKLLPIASSLLPFYPFFFCLFTFPLS